MCKVELRAVSPTGAVEELRRRFETWFVRDGEDFVFRSPLADDSDANAHLKWFYGMLEHDRKLIRRLQDQGLHLVVRIRSKQSRFVIEPDSLLIAHKLRLPVEIVVV